MPNSTEQLRIQKLFTPLFFELSTEQIVRAFQEILSGELTFKAAVKQGYSTLESIDDWVVVWHESHIECELQEFLGLTNDEYGRWLREATAMDSIVNE